MNASEFDDLFDNGADAIDFADMRTASRPNLSPRRVNIDFPAWMVERLDREAARLGIARQALVKTWLSERLERTPA